ncbi:hypothetical protein [Streptomyces sp. NPDC050856]|uniref:hypothetical protein n=1 Tax=Streptomyces sp. NPDC050856 TaxID=3154939 RepID=UPI0033FC33BA
MKFTTTTDAEMEIFLSVVGKHLGQIGADAAIDLHSDEPIEEAEPRMVFEEMSGEVQASPKRSKDPLMGVSVDLRSATGLRRFSLLGHRTMGCEAFVGNKLVFTSIENERIVWLDLPPADVSALEDEARAAGAQGLTRLA